MQSKKEIDKFADDMRACMEDIDSGDPKLQAHALGRFADIMTEVADMAEARPEMARVTELIRENVETALRI